MRKTIFAIIACCLAVTSTFSQNTIDFELSEDRPQAKEPIYDHTGFECGYFYVKIMDETDFEGQSIVQLELANTSDSYRFLLFDRIWGKKELRKNRVVLDKYYPGENSKMVQNIELLDKDEINEVYYGSYIFPNIVIEGEGTYECKIPVHLAKPKPSLFSRKRKKIFSCDDYNIRIFVDNRDLTFEQLEYECDTLLQSFNEALEQKKFCTNPHHKPSFADQIEKYTSANLELKNRITQRVNDKQWPTDSKKYKQYAALLASLDEMDAAYSGYKHDCGRHEAKRHKCQYCKLSLKQIYDRLNSLYQKLYIGEVEKADIIKEVKDLYKCCTDPTCATHAQLWKNDADYKAGIIEFYNKIDKY